VTPIRRTRLLTTIAAAALLAVVTGCGSDSSGETGQQASVSIPTVTSPLSSSSTAASAPTTQKSAKTTTSTGGSAPCAIPDAYEDFKFTGLDCASAVAVAQAWDSNGKDCNTIDNPNVDAGYQRTCSVEGYSCTAKRDVHSDARFVTCTQGGASIRFTWLPA
jgi:hypothetical protein